MSEKCRKAALREIHSLCRRSAAQFAAKSCLLFEPYAPCALEQVRCWNGKARHFSKPPLLQQLLALPLGDAAVLSGFAA